MSHNVFVQKYVHTDAHDARLSELSQKVRSVKKLVFLHVPMSRLDFAPS